MPFCPFAISLESGNRVVVPRPETIGFDPAAKVGVKAWDSFVVISNRLTLFGSFSDVTSVALVDRTNRRSNCPFPHTNPIPI